MKTALIFFKRTEEPVDPEYLSSVCGAFTSGGIDIERVEMLSLSDDLAFKRSLEELRDTADNLIVFGENAEFDIKGIIAEVMETEIIENENAAKFAEAVVKSTQGIYRADYALMPVEATVVPNLKGAYQGFMLEDNEFSLVFLPSEAEQIIPMCDGYVIPYFETKYGIKTYRLTLKYFGDESALSQSLEEVRKFSGEKFFYSLKTVCGDTTVHLTSAEKCEKKDFDNAVRQIVSRFRDNIYAEFDTTLGERLFDILKLRNLKMSAAESFTGGRVISSVIANPGASSYVDEGIVCYSNDSKKSRLGVKEEDLKRVGAVSSQVAYEMAAGLILSGRCDIAVSTTGIAGPASDDTHKPVGLNYIGIGMKDGVHVYKYLLTGSREEITETAKNTALFLAISKLKKL